MDFPLSKPRVVGTCAAALVFALAAPPVAAESSLGDTWRSNLQSGPSHAYEVNPPLSAATADRMKRGHWTGSGVGMNWAAPDKPYVVNPPLSAETIAKRRQGYFTGGGTGMNWHTPDQNEIETIENRGEGRHQTVLSQ